ncbi:MAG TPA: AfsR/SARP family transcriptional regulator [Streptosporangiaceae bacterium]
MDTDRSDGTVFSVGVLGPLIVRSEGAAVPVPAPKQRVILAALALRAGQAVSYDELAEIVWNGAPPDAARVAIRNYVKRLRHVLGPVAGRRILTRDPGYALDAGPDEVDALRFTAMCMKAGQAVRQVHEATRDQAMGASGTWDVLSEALGLWRGDPLVDVPSQMLVAAEVPPLDALRMQALEWRMDAGLAQGRHAELVGELTQLARDHPLRERFHAQLMLALYRCGRQAEALAAYSGQGACWWTSSGWSPAGSSGTCRAGSSTGIPAWPLPARYWPASSRSALSRGSCPPGCRISPGGQPSWRRWRHGCERRQAPPNRPGSR